MDQLAQLFDVFVATALGNAVELLGQQPNVDEVVAQCLQDAFVGEDPRTEALAAASTGFVEEAAKQCDDVQWLAGAL